jgi:hypothetical protein
MLPLLRRPLDMPVTHSRLFPRIRTIVHPARSPIIADPVDSHIVDDRPVHISIVYDGRIDVRHRGIVPESPTIPFTAIVTTATIPTSIVDPAIITYMRPPVADMPCIYAAYKSPVAGRP